MIGALGDPHEEEIEAIKVEGQTSRAKVLETRALEHVSGGDHGTIIIYSVNGGGHP